MIIKAEERRNPFMPTVAFNICCPRHCVSRHNGGTSGAPLKPLRVDSTLIFHALGHVLPILSQYLDCNL